MEISEILNIAPYSLNKTEKEALLSPYLGALTRRHYEHCLPYKKMLDSIQYDVSRMKHYAALPFLPVRLFKMFDLLSVPEEEIVKTVTSSGTSGQAVSKIYLDRNTSAGQTRALTKIVSSFTGKQRTPMIIIDTENAVKDRNLFSARGAGILGFSIFGNKRIFALNERMELNTDLLMEFVGEHQTGPLFLFGFTFMIYRHFYQELLKKKIKPDLSNAVMIHGGGWKKLASEAVTSEIFKKQLHDVCRITRVHDYYGMVEQTGTVYMECEHGHLHAPVFSDVIIRRPVDFSVAEQGEKGIVQVLSILPESYPGHSLLTEDEGILLGEDDCPCGRYGKYFKITGRLKNAEIRGCSDTYATKF